MQFNNEHFVNLLQEEEEDLVESDEDETKANQASHNKQWRKTSKTITIFFFQNFLNFFISFQLPKTWRNYPMTRFAEGIPLPYVNPDTENPPRNQQFLTAAPKGHKSRRIDKRR